MRENITLSSKDIEDISNSSEKKIAKLFDGFGFKFIRANYDVRLKLEKNGEIDLIFTYDNFLFLIEVSEEKNSSRKKFTFFSKWSDEQFLEPIRKNFDFSNKKIIKIYFDLYKNSYIDESDAVKKFLESKKQNIIGYKNDYEYFQLSLKKIGKWAKNDFLDWVGVSDKKKYEDIEAIQYYIQDLPVYTFVVRVDVLLNSCYISRRRRNAYDPGYQRMLNERRISKIRHNIEARRGLSFPNSILLHTPKLANTIITKDESPKSVIIKFPTSFCSCRIIDGQHRLLGFSNLEEEKLNSYFLTVIALPEINSEKEFTTFIDINSQQQKMDNNLILHLKSDFNWSDGSRERLDQIGVHVAEKLNAKVLKNRIYFGTSDETKGNKITLVTLVPALRINKQILTDEDKTYRKVSKIFALIGEHMPKLLEPTGFFSQNQGIRILFRLVQLFERNHQHGKISVNLNEFFVDLKYVLNDEKIKELFEHYGGGGAITATKQIIDWIKEINPQKYDNMQRTLNGI